MCISSPKLIQIQRQNDKATCIWHLLKVLPLWVCLLRLEVWSGRRQFNQGSLHLCEWTRSTCTALSVWTSAFEEHFCLFTRRTQIGRDAWLNFHQELSGGQSRGLAGDGGVWGCCGHYMQVLLQKLLRFTLDSRFTVWWTYREKLHFLFKYQGTSRDLDILNII